MSLRGKSTHNRHFAHQPEFSCPLPGVSADAGTGAREVERVAAEIQFAINAAVSFCKAFAELGCSQAPLPPKLVRIWLKELMISIWKIRPNR